MPDATLRDGEASPSDGTDPLLGRRLAGKYAIDKRLGGGAMGAVYRARHGALEKTVAIKVMHAELCSDAAFVQRFHREARAASRLDHPCSIRVTDFGAEADGLLYIVMEYVEGRDLFALMRGEGPLSPGRIVEILSQVLAALAVAHDMGVLHRDLKPENIMVQRGTTDEGRASDVVKVCDFGIAKIVDARDIEAPEGPKLSGIGLVIGTPQYMSPEQARGGDLDARSDLYSVGIMLYELLTGRTPFRGSAVQVMVKQIMEQPTAPHHVRPGVHPGLEAVCLKAIHKSPAERFANAREMRAALRAALADPASDRPTIPADLESMPTVAAPAPTPLVATAPALPRRRAKRKALLVALALSALAVAGVIVARFPKRPAHAVTPAQTVAAVVEDPPHPALPPIVNASPHDPIAAPPRPIRRRSPSAPPVPSATPSITPIASTPPALPTVSAPAIAVPAPPAPPPFDPSKGEVIVGTPIAAGASSVSVAKSIAPLASKFTACYRSALTRAGSEASGQATLHVETDEAGFIVGARYAGPLAPAMGACVAGAVRGKQIANVDTGTASAEVPLTLRVR